MKPIRYLMPVLISSVLLFACSTSQETAVNEQNKEPEMYVFDDVEKIDTAKTETDTLKREEQIFEDIQKDEIILPVKESLKFIVQVGAFTSKDRALTFVKENQVKIEYKMEISFSEQVQLYVVQLPPFFDREEAEKVRNTLWQNAVFKDAFIITIE